MNLLSVKLAGKTAEITTYLPGIIRFDVNKAQAIKNFKKKYFNQEINKKVRLNLLIYILDIKCISFVYLFYIFCIYILYPLNM